MSLADTAAQNGIMGKKAYLRHEKALWKLGLKPIPLKSDIAPIGIGGTSKAILKCAMPVGMGEVNGVIAFTVLEGDVLTLILHFHLT